MRNTLTMALLWVVSHLSAQWFDDFSHTLDSGWSGALHSFVINKNNELQLKASEAGDASLWHSVGFFPDMEWSFDIRLDFSPSASNRLVLYLLSGSDSIPDKYAWTLEIGESGNGDRWRMYAKSGNDRILVSEGQAGQFATGPLEFHCKILYTRGGNWKIQWENKNGEITNSQFYFTLPDPVQTSFFGVECIFTSTRKEAFFFDNVYVGPHRIDKDPPVILRISNSLPNQLKIQFNEEIDTLRSNESMHIALDTFSDILLRHWLSKKELQIDFASLIPTRETLTLHCDSIFDPAGNMISDTLLTFYLDPQKAPSYLDILISEIFPDPSPPRFLPEKEFIEFFNRTNKTLNLEHCLFSDLSNEITLPAVSMTPGSYLILCDLSDTAVFAKYGAVLGIKNIFSLNNAGDVLTLRDSSGNLIHQLTYDVSSYGEPLKEDGGYSIELTGIAHLCDSRNSLHASEDQSGGTPGRKNSWYDEEIDTSGPKLTDVYATSEWEITAVFDEALDPLIPYHAELFFIYPTRSIATVDFQGASHNALVILLNEPLEPGIHYQLHAHLLMDCIGNLKEIQSNEFGLPEQPETKDLVWSEVLFNPLPGHHDFVELYNRSQKFVDVSHLYIENPEANSLLYPILLKKTLAPGNYIAFTQDPDDLVQVYPKGIPTNIFKMEIPPLEDAGACLILGQLLGTKRYTIDSFCFLDSWHHPALEDSEGVSLEKINISLTSGSKSSWQSAAKDYGNATPGAPNSQVFNPGMGQVKKPYALSGHTIFLGEMGEKGEFRIQFNLQEPSYSCVLVLYDVSGQPLAKLYDGRIRQDELFRWFGEVMGSFFGQPGNYVVQIQLLHPSKKIEVFNERLSVIR